MQINSINKDMHIKDYISILQRRKWVIISFFLITVTAVTVATFSQKRVYRATATVIVETASHYFAYRDYIETQQEIIRSRRTVYHVMKNLKLRGMEEFKKSKDPIQTLLKKLHVELIRDTRIIAIHVDDGDPRHASMMANEFAKVYVNSNIALKTKMSRQAEAWLKEETEKQKKKVNDSELRLQVYKEENNIVSIENQEDMLNDIFAKLNSSYLDAQKRRIHAETVYRSLINDGGNVTLENLPVLVTENKSLQQLKDDYLRQEAILVEYKVVYKHRHPKMARVLENINYLKSRIKSEIETGYNSALQEENKFRKALDEQKNKALSLERKIINYNTLKREVKTNEHILQIVLNRLKETSISSQIQTNNVRVQDLAGIPKKPIRPRRKLNAALSIVLGLIGGAGLAFFREYTDTTLRDPSEIAQLLQIPVLGSIPRIRRDGKNIKKKEHIDRVVEMDLHSLTSEAYRSIRTNLLFSLNHSSSSKSIVITSSVPREGKTLTAVNLATMIANGGERVLLVDADMRKPRIHTIFNEDNESGLAQYLMGEKDFQGIVKYSGTGNLYFVTSGKTTHGSTESILSKNMKAFLEDTASQFSKIIFDTPPIALVTDAAVLSSMCTGVILIAEGGKTTKKILSNSKELLQKVNANILGIIVNNISLTKDIDS